MAKQQRATSSAGRSKAAQPLVPLTLGTGDNRHESRGGNGANPLAPESGHIDAVALYQEGLAALQAHDFSLASTLLRSLLMRYPGERELHERVRLYLNICERHIAPRVASPSTPEERVLAATLAINAGNYDEALAHLRTATSEAPEHDQALYLLASVLALRDEIAEAVPLLLRAIDLNPDNRSLARHDPDLRALREFHSVRVALQASSHAKTEARKALRRR
jgi:tetratricopeptide (TPR) repeat protein